MRFKSHLENSQYQRCHPSLSWLDTMFGVGIYLLKKYVELTQSYRSCQGLCLTKIYYLRRVRDAGSSMQD